MRVLVLSRYTRLGASSRLRTAQYLPFLEQQQFQVECAPFFDDAYLSALYAGRPGERSVISYFRDRVAALRRRPRPDLIWLEYEALPWLPWAIERLLLNPKRCPLVVDYDDAVFHRYDHHGNAAVRWLLGRKIDQIMRSASLVMAGNDYLAERAWHAGGSRVEKVPTVVDTHTYSARARTKTDTVGRIGWIGTPSTWTEYMAPLVPMLFSVAAARGARLRVVGAGRAATPHPLLDNLPWSEESEIARIQEMDIGIMPLTDTPWARGKCGYKLIQYMACGLPVVASPVGVNAHIVEHGVNGFLASSEAEWRTALALLLSNAELRRQMGSEGRRKVEREYSLQTWGPRVAGMLRGVARAGQTT
jgi:glycosyltransferase involved in cell wall biosynthesis